MKYNMYTRAFLSLPTTYSKTLILIPLFVYFKVLGVEIKIGDVPAYTHCIASNEPLQLLNPFSDVLGSDQETVINKQKFVSLEWCVVKPGKVDEDILIYITPTHKDIKSPKYTSYKLWSLQINNIEVDDTATYIARLVDTSEKKIHYFNLTVAKTPVLQSDTKTVTKEPNELAGKVTHKCGEIADLGTPPINFYWKFVRNASILLGDYRNGFFTITLPDNDEIICEINKTSPATKCIPTSEMAKWEGASLGQASASSDDTKYIIIGGIAGGILIGVILIIVLIVLIIKKKKGENYNAKKEEAKVEAQSQINIPLVDKSFNENDSHRQPRGGSRTPVYTGTQESPSPHTVPRTKANKSRIQQASDNVFEQLASDNDYEEYNANGKPPPVAPKYRKKSEIRDEGDEKDVQPPKVKPRSIFLTPSMEELDKINAAVQGGKGSEPRDTARRGSEPRDTARRGTEPRGSESKSTAPRGTLV